MTPRQHLGPADGDVGVYRAPMRSRLDEVDVTATLERALTLGLCGVGGRLAGRPRDLADAVRQVDAAWGERVARRLERFAAVPDDAQVWTRDPDGGFHHARLVGPWHYDEDPLAWAADLVHVRPCRWRPAEPPAAVLDAFARGGRNFQRVRDA